MGMKGHSGCIIVARVHAENGHQRTPQQALTQFTESIKRKPEKSRKLLSYALAEELHSVEAILDNFGEVASSWSLWQGCCPMCCCVAWTKL